MGPKDDAPMDNADLPEGMRWTNRMREGMDSTLDEAHEAARTLASSLLAENRDVRGALEDCRRRRNELAAELDATRDALEESRNREGELAEELKDALSANEFMKELTKNYRKAIAKLEQGKEVEDD